MTKPRLHPQSWLALRQLVKLHGGDQIVRAVREIEREYGQPVRNESDVDRLARQGTPKKGNT